LGIYLNTKDQALAKESVGYRVMSLMSVAYLLLFPLSSTVLPMVSGAIVSLTILSSISLYLFPFKGVKHSNHDERLFYFSVSFIVIVAVLATAVSGMDHLGMKKLGKFVYLLMVIPVYFYFRTVRINLAWLWYGLVAGAIISALVGVYEVSNDVFKPGYPGRAKGATHPIIFGDLALLIGAMALAGWGWFKQQARWQTVLPVVALSAGLLASILSQSRGGWVAVPFIMVAYIWFYFAQVSKTKMSAGVLLKNRAEITYNNIQAYIDADNKSLAGGESVTSRFEMWKASWDIFLKNPVLGVGWGNYQKNAEILVKKGERNALASAFDHPHNQFVSAMVSGGIVALVAILMLFFIPAKIFYTACKSADRSVNAQQIALAGLVLMIGFAVFNLSESFLERSRTTTFFIFYLAVFMAGIREKKLDKNI